MKCAKSQQDCEWCDKAWDCEIYQAYKRLKREERRRRWQRMSQW